MGDSSEPLLLAPLSIGEIFDRAITLLVRHWPVYVVIGLCSQLPNGIADLLSVAHPSSGSALAARLAGLLFGTIASMATAVVTEKIVHGEKPDVPAALGRAVWNIPGSVAVAIVAGLALVLVGIVAAMFGVTKVHFGSNVPVDIVEAMLLAAFAIAVLLIYFCTELAITALVIEETGSNAAIGKTLARAFTGGSFGRTSLAALTCLATLIVISVAAGYSNVGLASLLHEPFLGVVVETAILTAGTPILNVLITLFYFDLRARREGYDIETALASMESVNA